MRRSSASGRRAGSSAFTTECNNSKPTLGNTTGTSGAGKRADTPAQQCALLMTGASPRSRPADFPVFRGRKQKDGKRGRALRLNQSDRRNIGELAASVRRSL